ncbi:MAG: lipoprotein [Muribaculaceae bacterium]|nr:lipoprotein [Muribaculaceae bacterium]
MKKSLFLAAVAALALSSCNTISHTASTETINTQMYNRSTADLKVSPEVIKYTFVADNTYRRAGEKSVKNAAIAKALEANGGGDLLVAPQFEIKKHRGLFRTKIVSVTVTGHPATYVNVHPTTKDEAEVINTLGRRK